MAKSHEEPKAIHHEHPSHSYERLGLVEVLADKAILVVMVVLGAAMAIGLLTATGHVTW